MLKKPLKISWAVVQSVSKTEGPAIMGQTIHFLLESVQAALLLFEASTTTQLLQLAVNGE